jgi:hypothetical protein
MRVSIQLFKLQHCWSISTGSCLTTLLTDLISICATTLCLTTLKTGCDHSASAIMICWWKMPKRGWAHTWQTSMLHAHTYLFPVTSASILGVTTSKNRSSIYVFVEYNKTFSFIACFVDSSPKVTIRIYTTRIFIRCSVGIYSQNVFSILQEGKSLISFSARI